MCGGPIFDDKDCNGNGSACTASQTDCTRTRLDHGGRVPIGARTTPQSWGEVEWSNIENSVENSEAGGCGNGYGWGFVVRCLYCFPASVDRLGYQRCTRCSSRCNRYMKTNIRVISRLHELLSMLSLGVVRAIRGQSGNLPVDSIDVLGSNPLALSDNKSDADWVDSRKMDRKLPSTSLCEHLARNVWR
jgi:hypothetical protein